MHSNKISILNTFLNILIVTVARSQKDLKKPGRDAEDSVD